jgi:hypothetical protein
MSPCRLVIDSVKQQRSEVDNCDNGIFIEITPTISNRIIGAKFDFAKGKLKSDVEFGDPTVEVKDRRGSSACLIYGDKVLGYGTIDKKMIEVNTRDCEGTLINMPPKILKKFGHQGKIEFIGTARLPRGTDGKEHLIASHFASLRATLQPRFKPYNPVIKIKMGDEENILPLEAGGATQEPSDDSERDIIASGLILGLMVLFACLFFIYLASTPV